MRLSNYFDRHNGEEDEPPRIVECNRCGQAGLHWEEDNGRWRLCTAKFAIHVCDEKRLHRADDFEDLTDD